MDKETINLINFYKEQIDKLQQENERLKSRIIPFIDMYEKSRLIDRQEILGKAQNVVEYYKYEMYQSKIQMLNERLENREKGYIVLYKENEQLKKELTEIIDGIAIKSNEVNTFIKSSEEQLNKIISDNIKLKKEKQELENKISEITADMSNYYELEGKE